MERGLPVLVLAAYWILASSFAAWAAGLTVSPVRLALSPEYLRGVITVRNVEATPVLAQTQGFVWTQQGGEDRLTPADNLIVVPPVFTLEPNGEQAVRVGFRHRPEANGELAYRVVISQVPNKAEPGQGVQLVVQLSLPVFVTPALAKANLKWTAESVGPRVLRISLHNTGSAHLRVTRLAVFLPPQTDQAMADQTMLDYVLANAMREWTLALGQPLDSDSVILQAETNLGPLQEILPVSH
jgi:fimbrial chaperone protein